MAYSLYIALNMIYGIRPIAPNRPVQLAVSLGIMVTGWAMVMFAAVLKQKSDETLTPRQTAALAALDTLTDALAQLSPLLLIGTTVCFFSGHRTAAFHLGIFLLAAIVAHWGVLRLEKRIKESCPSEVGIPPQDG
jgi:hypothetical protein